MLAKVVSRPFVSSSNSSERSQYDLDPKLSPSDATNERKLRISNLSRPILSAFTSTPPDPLAVRAVRQATTPLVLSIVSIVRQMEKTRGKKVGEASLGMGGGVIRQPAYRKVVVDMLADEGVRFGVEQVVDDVAGEGAMGLVEKARTSGQVP